MESINTYRNDRGVVDYVDVLNGHRRNLRNKNAPERIGDGWIDPNDVKFHVVAPNPLHGNLEVPLKFLVRPAVVHAQC